MGISTDFSVAIAGAGLSGLCLAQYLMRAGVDVHVYERDPSPFVRQQGYRIILDRHGLQALRESLPRPLYRLALTTGDEPGGQLRFTDSRLRDAFTITFKDEPHATRQVDRATLRSILMLGLDGRIHYGKPAVAVERGGPSGLRLRFTDGGSVAASVVVGADGVGSALRAQLMPDADPANTPMAGIYSRSPLRRNGESVIPGALRTSGVLAIADQPSRAFFFTSMRFGESPREAFARLAPGGYAPTGDDYVMWGLLLRQQEVPIGARGDLLALRDLAVRMSADFHPLIRRLVDTAELDTTVLNPFAAGRRPHRWAVPGATMMGDAVHVMPPFGAHGGNTALRDAALLGHRIVEALASGTPVQEAIARYQDEMVSYAFRAVDTAAGLMRRLTGAAAAPHWILTRVLPRLHRVTVPEA
ncbi:2-polyprenyl-6-methoxyphenol hydroxylase-like FAD-dependent oxidoreductase [Actinoplanes campanulatus]|uniref:2-polyprenyl-6-methoxyphenol hydroxylase-like FAD-dependent oxidoreductase n=1 Tax=Actinoplanes campanulatus TaxID=113559 RepID=A0A7W5FEX1_9ACTN|nr:NAD(P)/FAD-dependent oxidoreductase [Actinoplanes campanulatus]MBB3095757.1 2-polyprenyl-6-methoxyphenol hydroxylase-like FAD-dependent oxidoreductase [Actinoplanes campanulatus]GGN11301.1 FAD-dependent oxidoreductase [Actinoplanes campanulatus]GID36654.1 FAD-dependent oxidoreductase [Actinoplanes campanulatus]